MVMVCGEGRIEAGVPASEGVLAIGRVMWKKATKDALGAGSGGWAGWFKDEEPQKSGGKPPHCKGHT